MEQIRTEKGLGLLPHTSAVRPGDPGMIEAKFNIASVLDIPINSVERFKERVGLSTAKV